MGKFLILVCFAVWAFNSMVHASEQESSTLILVSIDGFRWDFAGLSETPAFDQMAREGLQAESLRPVFPTLTFPNHLSIATGMFPARHGIVANEFPDETREAWYRIHQRETVEDGRWYKAEPIWVTAEKHGIPTAAYYFAGTEADVGGQRPARWHSFSKDISAEERTDTVLAWLNEPAESRPGLITLYFEHVDDHTHWYGIGSPQSREKIRLIDQQLGRLIRASENLRPEQTVHLVVVSDHGQAAYASEREVLVLSDVVDMENVIAVDSGPMVSLYFENSSETHLRQVTETINAHWTCGRAMRAQDTPSAWRVKPGGRFADIYVVADAGCGVVSRSARQGKITAGDHGWAPELRDMHGVLYAWGPRIKPGSKAQTVDAVDVHPLLLDLLGLSASVPTDSNPVVLQGAIRPTQLMAGEEHP